MESSSVNGTREPDSVTFFIIQGLSSLGDRQMIPFVILLLGYIIILGGNSIIIFTLTDPKINSPMYFFLANLSFVDMVYTTNTIPKMLAGFLSDVSIISIQGCFVQMFFFVQQSTTGHSILTVMAYDRYTAICKPLHYTSIMTRNVRLLLIAGAWGFGIFIILPVTILAVRRSYCRPNVLKHGWCDPASVRQLACGDISFDNIVSLCFATVSLLIPGLLILTSYILIGISISKMGVAQRLKAFRTCGAHLTAVSISFTSASFVSHYRSTTSMSNSVLYAALTPFLNPVIYSLRNKELQESIRRTLVRFRSATVSATKNVSTVS
uniref:G-protein coupled receptors family 1 profile domain-containing protein n=1 Tax=Monopterus albus TaxID=43700 RepID=A0A3Q3PY26_MONAL